MTDNRPEPWFNDPNIDSVMKDRLDGGTDIYIRDETARKGYSHSAEDPDGNFEVYRGNVEI